MKFTLIKQQQNTGRRLCRVTEPGSFIPYSTDTGRIIPWHVLYSGTRLLKRKFIMMCLFRVLLYVKTVGLWAVIAFCVTPIQPTTACCVTFLQPLN